eukprot:6082582-Amphidinium_carterae.1
MVAKRHGNHMKKRSACSLTHALYLDISILTATRPSFLSAAQQSGKSGQGAAPITATQVPLRQRRAPQSWAVP